jgi:hypothetical protein
LFLCYCSVRQYLNGEFLNSFSAVDKARIALVTNTNPNNPWFGTAGGEDTDDYIFLLSLDEVVRYFGDSGQLANGNPNSDFWINDQFNDARIAFCTDTACCNASSTWGHWWWLRSPGIYSYRAACVDNYGYVYVDGFFVDFYIGGVRPALWLEMKQPADTGAGGVGAAAALFLVGAAVCVKSVRRK